MISTRIPATTVVWLDRRPFRLAARRTAPSFVINAPQDGQTALTPPAGFAPASIVIIIVVVIVFIIAEQPGKTGLLPDDNDDGLRVSR